MRFIISTILVMGVLVFSGCIDSSSGKPVGGVMKSDDGGRTFESRVFIDENSSLANSNVLSMAIDPANSNIVYVGTARNGLHKSTDGAESWSKVQTGIIEMRGIAINPFDTQTIYVSGYFEGRGSVIKSVDGGDNWDRVYVEPADGTNITSMIVSPINGDMVYIGTSGGTIARTLSGGQSWENLYHAQNSVNDLAIDAADVNTLYALINGVDVVKSRDDGVTFEKVRDLERDSYDDLYQGTLYSMTTSPSVPGSVVVGTNKGVFLSRDYGHLWEPVDVIASTVDIPIHAIEMSPHSADRLVYAAAKAVYTKVSDGWAITDTTSNRSVSVIAHDPFNANIVYIGLKNAK